MQKNNIKPEAITKPIQLLAVWLLGLLLLVSGLLTAANILNNPVWLPSFLTISAVAIIPLFLTLIFLLQTKFRPEMQEDSYYSKYLNKETNRFETVKQNAEESIKMNEIIEISNVTKKQLAAISDLLIEIDKKNGNRNTIEPLILDTEEQIESLKKRIKLNEIRLSINTFLPKYIEIVNIVKNMGFTKYDTFGDTKIPFQLVISFGRNITADIIRDLITPMTQLTECYIKQSTTADNAIVIGSYREFDDNTYVDKELLFKLENVHDNHSIVDIID